MPHTNRQLLLRARPKGPVSNDHFEAKTSETPVLQDGEALVKTLYLSIDPTIRGWMERDTFLPAIPIGAVIRSAGAGVVVESKNPSFSPGDRLFSMTGWQEYAVVGKSDNS